MIVAALPESLIVPPAAVLVIERVPEAALVPSRINVAALLSVMARLLPATARIPVAPKVLTPVLAGNAPVGGRGRAGRWRGRHAGSSGPKAALIRLVRADVRRPVRQLVASTNATVSPNSCRDN